MLYVHKYRHMKLEKQEYLLLFRYKKYLQNKLQKEI